MPFGRAFGGHRPPLQEKSSTDFRQNTQLAASRY
jgi:hypothetical protein